MGWGSNSKNGRKPTHARGTVVWTDNTGVKPAPFAQNIPRYKESKIPDEYIPYLYPGSLWKVKVPLSPDTKIVGMSVLKPFYYPADMALVKVNSLVIYAGEVRSEERQSNGRIVSVPKHTFVASGGRHIITDFFYVVPVT